MIKEARGFGATLNEAKENAVKELNASEFDDIKFDIISMPKKKILGLFGGAKAEVRAYYEVAEKKQKSSKKNLQKKDKKEVKPVKAETKPVEKPAAKAEAKKENEYSEPVTLESVDAESPAGRAAAYVKTVIDALNCKDVEIKVALRQGGALLILTGDDLNIIIGRRGETLDALQYLASLTANNGGGHYKVSINVGNYRQKREETLTALAQRVAEQAIKAGKCRTLEPMNPYERRIIHTAVQEIDGVVSGSFGEGANRRVVIAPEGVELKPRRDDHRRGNQKRSSRPKPASAVVTAPAREPKKDSDIPLYGKIN